MIASAESLTGALGGVDGWLAEREAWALHRAVATFPGDEPVSVVEIGSFKGRSTIALATGVAARPAGGVVHAIDPHRGGVAHELTGEEDSFPGFLANLGRAGVRDLVDPIRATSAAARDRVADGSVHVLFVDGSHRLEDVVADIQAWASALRPGARVAFHDAITFPGVAEALRRLVLAPRAPFRSPRLVQDTLFVDYRPDVGERAGDAVRALAMRGRLAGLRAARRWAQAIKSRP